MISDQELDQMADDYARERAERELAWRQEQHAERERAQKAARRIRASVSGPTFAGGSPLEMGYCQVCDGRTSCRGGRVDGSFVDRVCHSCFDWFDAQLRELAA